MNLRFTDTSDRVKTCAVLVGARAARTMTEDAIPGEETRIVTIHDLIDTLCQISRDHQIDWEVGHDGHEGPAGYIRSDMADDKLVTEIDRLSAEIEEARKLRFERRQAR